MAPTAHHLHVDVGGQVDHHLHAAGGHTSDLSELAGKDAGDICRFSNEVEVAAAQVRHRFQQMLIKAHAHAKGGGGNPAGCQLAGVGAQFFFIGNAAVCQPISEQQHPVERSNRLMLRHQVAALHPSAGEIGGVPGFQAVNCLIQAVPPGRIHARAGGIHGHLVVKTDEGNAVSRGEQRNNVTGSLFNKAQLVSAHRAGAVNHQRQVERGTCNADQGRRRTHSQFHHPLGGGLAGNPVTFGLQGDCER